VMRDLKRIHSHICSVAYPVLEAAGALQPDLQRGMENQSTAEDSVVAKGRAEPRPS
jgi:phosphate:Na+ symporter